MTQRQRQEVGVGDLPMGNQLRCLDQISDRDRDVIHPKPMTFQGDEAA